jgi:hypothetical protein
MNQNIIGGKMIFNIQDIQKGKISYDLNRGHLFKSFNAHCKKHKFSLQHMADIVKDPSKTPGYSYNISSKEDWKRHNGWAYLLVIDGRIAKIGMTEVTLSSRFSSYQAGTVAARKKGTCSVTNYYCSEVIRKALSMGLKIQIYAYKVPHSKQEVKVFNEEKTIFNKIAYVYEEALLREHTKVAGQAPPLCKNTSKI